MYSFYLKREYYCYFLCYLFNCFFLKIFCQIQEQINNNWASILEKNYLFVCFFVCLEKKYWDQCSRILKNMVLIKKECVQLDSEMRSMSASHHRALTRTTWRNWNVCRITKSWTVTAHPFKVTKHFPNISLIFVKKKNRCF